MNACSPYLEKTLIETPMPLKSQLQTFCRMNNIQHTLLINVSSITAIYLFFHCFFFSSSVTSPAKSTVFYC